MIVSGIEKPGIYDTHELMQIRNAVDAVCSEMGVSREDQKKREHVATHVMRSWAKGQRTPLGLVQAGLDSFN